MFTDSSQGRLKIDMDATYNDDTHPYFRKMKNVALLQLDDLDCSNDQLVTFNFLGDCFGSSVRHLKLGFNGGTSEMMNNKAWCEAFSAFHSVETLSLKVHSGLNYFHLFRHLSDKHSTFVWFRTIRKIELLDIWT